MYIGQHAQLHHHVCSSFEQVRILLAWYMIRTGKLVLLNRRIRMAR